MNTSTSICHKEKELLREKANIVKLIVREVRCEIEHANVSPLFPLYIYSLITVLEERQVVADRLPVAADTGFCKCNKQNG